MKQALLLLIAICVAAPAYAEVDATLDGIIKASQNNLKELTAIDKSDKDLKISNEAQAYSSRAAAKLEREVKQALGPLQMEANRADQFRREILAKGCPEHGGQVALALAQRCNPLIRQHRAMANKIQQRVKELKQKERTASTLRTGVTKKTLENTQKKKRNDAERARLQAQKIEIQTRAVMYGLKNKAAAEKACNAMSSLEGKACCHKVVFDGANPKSCGVNLMCQAFERAGMFGRGVVICRPS